MNWLLNKKTAFKIGLLISIMAISLGIVGFVGYFYFHQAGASLDNLYSNNLIQIRDINQARSDGNALKSSILAITTYNLDDATKKQQLEQVTLRENSIDKFLTSFQPMATTAYEAERITKAKDQFKNLKDVIQKTLAYSQAGNRIEAMEYYYNNGFSKQEEFQTLLREIGNFNIDKAKTQVTNDNITIAKVQLVLLILPIMAIIIAVLIGILITRMIVGPLNMILKKVEQVANGDLNVDECSIHSKDEVGLHPGHSGKRLSFQ